MAGNEKSDDGAAEKKLIATVEVMLRLENVMCCVLWGLRRILNAVVLRLEIWKEGWNAVRGGALRMLASSGAILVPLHGMAMHGNRLRYMTQMYTHD